MLCSYYSRLYNNVHGLTETAWKSGTSTGRNQQHVDDLTLLPHVVTKPTRQNYSRLRHYHPRDSDTLLIGGDYRVSSQLTVRGANRMCVRLYVCIVCVCVCVCVVGQAADVL